VKILTARQKAVLRYIERCEVPPTVSEIAAGFNAPVSSVRSIVTALERHGCIERRGVAFSGGVTWGPIQRVVP
jgi:DNA-binding IclR family transcriptional regulator